MKNIGSASDLVKAIALGKEVPPLEGTLYSFVWENRHKVVNFKNVSLHIQMQGATTIVPILSTFGSECFWTLET